MDSEKAAERARRVPANSDPASRVGSATETAPLPVYGRPLLTAFLALGVLVFAGTVLSLGSGVLIPVAQAVFFCFIVNGLAVAIRRLPVVGQHIPWPAALLSAALILLVLAFLAVESSVRMVSTIDPERFRTALDPLLGRVAGWVGSDSDRLLSRIADRFGIESLISQIVVGGIAFVNSLGVVTIYVAFLLIDQQFFEKKLDAIAKNPVQRDAIRNVLRRIGDGVQRYIWIMTVVSALTAALSYLVMLMVGLENPTFWAILIFFLNFIPTIGSIIGTVVPATYGLLQFQDLSTSLLLFAGIGTVQFTIGNILLPRMSANGLNISLFGTVFALFVWGTLWGVTGMFLAVPITAAMIVVFGTFPPTRYLAVLLSRTGVIET